MNGRLRLRQLPPTDSADPITVPESVDFNELLQKSLKAGGQGHLAEFSERLRAAGVGANRWTSPDLLAQLGAAGGRAVDLVVCNGLDSDDMLPLQGTVAGEYAAEIVAAVALLGAAVGAKRQVIALDSSDATNRRNVENAAKGTNVRVVALDNRYPLQNPSLLLYTLDNRRLSPGRLPTDVGALVFDAAAAAAMGRCLVSDVRSDHTPIGIADMRQSSTGDRVQLVSAPIGMPFDELFRTAGITEGPMEVRGGSPLREVVLEKFTRVSLEGEAAIYLVDPQPPVDPDPCIRCGWCVSSCPVHIQPAGILHAAQLQDRAMAERYGIESCIECGICSYVCPSHLPLLKGVRAMPRSGDTV